MSIANAYDNFNAIVAATLPTFQELPDNVVVENNADYLLSEGYAIEFSGDRNDGRNLTGLTGIEQTVFVTLTVSNVATESDINARKAAEKKLLAAKDAIVKAVAGDPNLGDTVAKCIYESSEGVQLAIDKDEKLFLMIRSTYLIGYFEQNT